MTYVFKGILMTVFALIAGFCAVIAAACMGAACLMWEGVHWAIWLVMSGLYGAGANYMACTALHFSVI